MANEGEGKDEVCCIGSLMKAEDMAHPNENKFNIGAMRTKMTLAKGKFKNDDPVHNQAILTSDAYDVLHAALAGSDSSLPDLFQ